jgi:hypothetical protein
MPGTGELIEGAMQQAEQAGRHSMAVGCRDPAGSIFSLMRDRANPAA